MKLLLAVQIFEISKKHANPKHTEGELGKAVHSEPEKFSLAFACN